jgi:D-arabinose 1-dehydrogenase-like Zn-dependent alcohol dehydrogenase
MTSIVQHVYRSIDNGPVKKVPSELPGLGPKQVLIRVTHSSLCATDLAYVNYGIALGHEGIGIVEKVGSEVLALKVGDRVGGGYHRGSCGHCSYCLTGNDIWCYERVIFGEGDFGNGTFADYFIGSETYVHKIPDSISSEHAAPLQCAGATVYSALIDTVKPNSRVGIVGIGGLGHLAIQFASKMGAEVVVFSSSASKEAEARSFGAKEFYLLGEAEKVSAPVQTLILSGNTYPDWSK